MKGLSRSSLILVITIIIMEAIKILKNIFAADKRVLNPKIWKLVFRI